MEKYINDIKIVLLVAEALAAVAGFLYWKKLKETFWKYLPIYLLWVSLAEWTGRYFAAMEWYGVNYYWYTFLVIPTEYFFWFWLLRRITPTDSKTYSLPLAFGLGYVAVFVIDVLFLSNQVYFFSSFSSSIGSIFLIILLLTYYYRVIFSANLIHYTSRLESWVTIGLFSNFLLSFPYYGMLNTLITNHYQIFLIYQPVVLSIATTMYICFIIGFIWGKTK